MGTYARIAPRSSLAFNHNVHIGGGVIDPDYRGNIKVGLFNHGEKDFEVNPGDRIAQLIFEKAVQPSITAVEELTSTDRGSQGFGSTETRVGTPMKKSRVFDEHVLDDVEHPKSREKRGWTDAQQTNSFCTFAGYICQFFILSPIGIANSPFRFLFAHAL